MTPEKINAFIDAVGEDAFVLSDIAEELNIEEDEALDLLMYVTAKDLIRLKCIWVPQKKEEKI